MFVSAFYPCYASTYLYGYKLESLPKCSHEQAIVFTAVYHLPYDGEKLSVFMCLRCYGTFTLRIITLSGSISP